tara:strand:+ start:40 stop:210 length:171 start_codon:yes stop_codon:yes gene_type:complete
MALLRVYELVEGITVVIIIIIVIVMGIATIVTMILHVLGLFITNQKANQHMNMLDF